MTTITVEVPDEIAKEFSSQKVVKMNDLLDYDDSLKYSFSDEKITLNELSNFLGEAISSKKGAIC